MDNKIIIDMYLDWFNNFLTLEKFAEYYNLDMETAEAVIEQGRKLNNTK